MQTSTSRTRWLALPAVLGTPVVVTIATWWLVGDLSDQGPDVGYTFGPVGVDPRLQHLLGLMSAAAIALAVVVLVRVAWWREFAGRWSSVLIPLAVAGVLSGAGGRLLTQGIEGGDTNLFVGFVIVFDGSAVAALLLWAVVRSIYLACSGRG